MKEFVFLFILGACGLVTAQERRTINKCNYCGVNGFCYRNIECRCPQFHQGNPYFLCYRPNRVDVCQICDDPVVTTQNKESVAVSYFNSSLLVDQMEQPGRQGVKCRVRVFESRERNRGKSVPRCIRVRLDLKTSTNKPVCSIEYKIFASVDSNGLLKWRIETGFASPGGDNEVIQRNPWMTLTNRLNPQGRLRICNCLVRFVVTGNILLIRNSCCRNVIGIRPFVRKIRWLKSGVFIIFPKRAPVSLPPGDIPDNFPLCLSPGVTINDVAERLGVSNTRHAMSYLALTNLPDDLSAESSARKAMRDALVRCSPSELRNLFDNTFFMVNSPPFIREISGDNEGYEDMMEMVTQSAEWFCEQDEGSCREILETIDESAKALVNNPVRFPMLAAFVAQNCTST